MTTPEPSLSVNVDVANPGQFFACCGLLELADRLWPGAEAWFQPNSVFCIRTQTVETSATELIERVQRARLTGELSPSLKKERDELEIKRRQLEKEGGTLGGKEEDRRQELGSLLRQGSIVVGDPFDLVLDWWKEETEELPKTWAGSQQVLRIAQAALDAAGQAFATPSPFTYECVLRPLPDGDEYLQATSNPNRRTRARNTDDTKVEPFYFDASRGVNARALDIGFMPDALKMTSAAFPAVEFLCLVGLQRFRPMPTDTPRVFVYSTWSVPLPPLLAAAAACDLLPGVGGLRYRFENAFRTDQRKHKGFLPATRIGGTE
jgi:CRISPR-associated protein Csx14